MCPLNHPVSGKGSDFSHEAGALGNRQVVPTELTSGIQYPNQQAKWLQS